MKYTLLRRFCLIALLEGISYLLLLFIAMPLKYWGHIPEPVKYAGWAHGVLFVVYALTLVFCQIKYKWSLSKTAITFMASLLPVAPFIIEKKLKKEYGLTS